MFRCSFLLICCSWLGFAETSLLWDSRSQPATITKSSEFAYSPDGAFLYLLSNTALATYRVVAGGVPEVLDIEWFQEGGQSLEIEVSPDGLYLYAFSSNWARIYYRNSDTGLVVYKGLIEPWDATARNDSGFTSANLSASGRYLVLSSWHALYFLERDETTGGMVLVDYIESTDGSIRQVVADPDDRGVYLFRWDQIHFAGLDEKGCLSQPELQDTGDWVRDAALTADGGFLYTVDSESNQLSVYSRDASSSELTLLERHIQGVRNISRLEAPLRVVLSVDQQWVHVSSYLSESVTMFQRGDDGRLVLSGFFRDQGGALNNPQTVIFHPSLPQGLVMADETVHTFSMDTASGSLALSGALEEPTVEGSNYVGGRTWASRDGKFMYTYWSNSSVFQWYVSQFDSQTGMFTSHSTVPSLDMGRVEQLLFSEDGSRTLFLGNGVRLISRDPETGVFSTNLGVPTCGFSCTVNTMTFGRDADTLFIQYRDQFVSILTYDYRTAAYEKVGEIEVPATLETSSLFYDSEHDMLWLGGRTTALFKYDSESNELTQVQLFNRNSRGIDGVEYVQAGLFSEDGQHVYLGSDEGVTLFDIDGSGSVRFREFYDAETIGVSVDDVIEMTYSSDGTLVYVTSKADDGKVFLSTFEVLENGGLQLREKDSSGYSGIAFMDDDLIVKTEGFRVRTYREVTVYEKVAPWVVNNAGFTTTLAIYNPADKAVTVTLEMTNVHGVQDSTVVQIMPNSVFTREADQIFTGRSGYSLLVRSEVEDLAVSFLTYNVEEVSGGRSPSQAVAASVSELTDRAVFGYVPGEDTSALVLVAPDAVDTVTVDLELFSSQLGAIDSVSVELEPGQPLATLVSTLFADSESGEAKRDIPADAAVTATSAKGEKLAGTTFIFNELRQPSMTAAFARTIEGRVDTTAVTPWVVNNSGFSSRITLFNSESRTATVEMTAVGLDGAVKTHRFNMAGPSVQAFDAEELFPGMSGYSLYVDSTQDAVLTSFLTLNLEEVSGGRSPSQTTAPLVRELGSRLVFGYVPGQDIAALVVTPVDETVAQLVFEMYDHRHGLVERKEVEVTARQPYVALVESLFEHQTDHASIEVSSPNGGKLAGVTFVFNQLRQPSMTRAFSR